MKKPPLAQIEPVMKIFNSLAHPSAAFRLALAIASDEIEPLRVFLKENQELQPVIALTQWLRSPIECAETDELSEAFAKAATPPRLLNIYPMLGFASLEQRLTELFLAAPLDGRLAERAQALKDAGLVITPELAVGLAMVSARHSDSNGLLWLVESGHYPFASPSARRAERDPSWTIFNTFKKQSEEDLRILEELVKKQVFVDDAEFSGVTNFVAQGLLRCARKLHDLGFKLRPQTRESVSSQDAGLGTVAAYATRAARAVYAPADNPPMLIDHIKPDLLELLAMGASLSPASNCSPHEERLSDPFLASIRCRSRDPKKSQLMIALYAALAELGATPNASGAYLAQEVMILDEQGGDTTYFDNALKLGADPALKPGFLLSAPAAWRGCMRIAGAQWLDKLIALGADPAQIPIRCPANEHPVETAIRDENYLYARVALNRGVSPEWVDSNDGSTLFHSLATQSETDAVLLCSRLLKDSRSKPLVNQQRFSAEGKGGETALMLACAQLNLEQARALLEAGADPNLQDAQGWTALRHAGRKYGAKAQKKCAPVISLLLAAKADPGLADHKGLTPGQAMAKRSPIEGLCELLSLRPEDLTGSSIAAKKTARELNKRGQEAASRVEQAILNADSLASSTASRPQRRRL